MLVSVKAGYHGAKRGGWGHPRKFFGQDACTHHAKTFKVTLPRPRNERERSPMHATELGRHLAFEYVGFV